MTLQEARRMTPEQLRVQLAQLCGWSGCTDVKCEWRKAPHLHKNGDVGFFESYSTKRVPNYPEDLNAVRDVWVQKIEWTDLEDRFSVELANACIPDHSPDGSRPNLSDADIAVITNATALQRTRALILTLTP